MWEDYVEHKASLPVSHQACVWSRWYRRWAGLANTLCFVHTDMKVKLNQVRKDYSKTNSRSNVWQHCSPEASSAAMISLQNFICFAFRGKVTVVWSENMPRRTYREYYIALERRLTIMTGLRMEGKCRSSNFPCVPKAPFFYSFGW